MNETKLKNKKVLAIFDNEDAVSYAEFVKSFENVVKHILKLEKDLLERDNKKMETLEAHYMETIKMLKEAKAGDVEQMKAEMMKIIKNMVSEHEKKMQMMDKKMMELHDGKDADEEMIVGKVLAQIPEQKEVILDNAEQVRNKLETLKDDERLNLSAIKGLQDEIQLLKEEIAKAPKGQRLGMKKITSVRSVDLSSQVNGVATTFTLPHDTLKVLMVMSTQFPILYRDGSDFTFAGRTLTLTPVVETGQSLAVLIETAFYA